MCMATADESSSEVPDDGGDARRLDHVEVLRSADHTKGAGGSVYIQSPTSWGCVPAETGISRLPPTWRTVNATPYRAADIETVAAHTKMVGASQHYLPLPLHDIRDEMTASQQFGTVVETPTNDVADQMAAAIPLRDDFDIKPRATVTRQEEACVACETVHRYIAEQGEHFVTHKEAITLGKIYERIRRRGRS